MRFYNGTACGRLGFEVDCQIFQRQIEALCQFAREQNYSGIVLAHDGDYWTSLLAEERGFPVIEQCGLSCATTEKPVTGFELSWLLTQIDGDQLGIYVNNNSFVTGTIALTVFEGPDSVIETSNLQKIIRGKLPKRCTAASRTVDVYNLDGYTKFIRNEILKADVSQLKAKPIAIDAMFGAATYCVQHSTTEIPWDLKIINPQTNTLRLLNYTSSPTGSQLRWASEAPQARGVDFLFGISHEGKSLGVWDVKQKIEISPGGTFIALMAHTPEIKRILIPNHFSERVSIIAGNKNITVDTYSTAEDLRRFNLLDFDLIGKESGCHTVVKDEIPYKVDNPLITIFKLIKTAEAAGKSLGQIIDSETEQNFQGKFYFNNIYIDATVCPLKKVTAAIRKVDSKLKSSPKNKTILRNKDSKIVILERPLDQVLQVFMETNSEEKTREMSIKLQNLLFDRV